MSDRAAHALPTRSPVSTGGVGMLTSAVGITTTGPRYSVPFTRPEPRVPRSSRF